MTKEKLTETAGARLVMYLLVPTAILAAVLLFPWWPLGWRGAHYWTTAAALATVLGAFAAIIYVSLTYGLWREAADQRETELMLRLIEEYDALRPEIMKLQDWRSDMRHGGVTDLPGRFEFEATDRFPTFEILDEARFRISRFFVRTRKLSAAKLISERVVEAAIDREAVADVFLSLVDPLDKKKAGDKYKADDHDFYTALLRHYPKNDQGTPRPSAERDTEQPDSEA